MRTIINELLLSLITASGRPKGQTNSNVIIETIKFFIAISDSISLQVSTL